VAARLIVATIIGGEIQHYQDPEQVDLRGVLDGQLRQLADWLTPRHGASQGRGERVW
jgi:hypothetical protein